ncbi:hypothetical protein AKJ16_DCAP16446 [Drosera capensis]
MIIRAPERTVIGLNAESRRQWVYCHMKDPLKNGTLAVQTIRNNMMASTQPATISITLSSLISAFVSSYNSSSDSSSTKLSSTSSVHTYKYFAILVCFLLAFFCYLQCTGYYAHVSFFVSLPSSASRRENIEYVVKKLNRGGIFWSLGLRAFYLSFPLMLWILVQFLCSCAAVARLLCFISWTRLIRLQGNSTKERTTALALLIHLQRRLVNQGI